jgi:membrane-associated phospholipid phosphatase
VTIVGDWDRKLLDSIDAHRTGWADGLAKLVMYVGITPWTLALGGLAALGLVVWLHAYRPAFAGVASLVVAVVAAEVLKQVFGLARPPADQALVSVGGPSFPSTQAAATAALTAGVLAAWAWSSRRTAYAATAGLVALDVLVGVCMVYLGAHWVSDVLAGWLLGGVVGLAIGRRLRTKRVPRDPTPV